MKLLDKFTPQFLSLAKKTIISFVVIASFVILGVNQYFLNNKTIQAVTTSNQAFSVSNQTFKEVRALIITPTVIPTATPSALKSTIPTRIGTPASAKK